MREVAYPWEAERRLEDRFSVFLIVAMFLHVGLISLSMGASEALDLDVRDVSSKASAAEQVASQQVIHLDLKLQSPETPAVVARVVPSFAAVEIKRSTTAQEAGPMALPEALEGERKLVVGEDRRVQAVENLMEVPDAEEKDLPAVRQQQVATLPEEVRQEVPPAEQLAVRQPISGRKVRLQETPRRQLHPKRSLLTDPVPSEKPSIKVLKDAVSLDELEMSRMLMGPLGRIATPVEAREARTDALSPSAAQAKRLSGQAKRDLLPLPQPSMPRVPLTPDGGELPPGWSAERLNAYKSALQELLNSAGRYPAASLLREEQGVTTVRFSVNRSGRLLSVFVIISSDFARLDAAALEMVRDAAPFPPFPETVEAQTILFEVDIIFSLGG